MSIKTIEDILPLIEKPSRYLGGEINQIKKDPNKVRNLGKLIREDDLYGAVESAYSQGWRRMKLYFLTGLPTETDEDTLGIVELARNCVELGRAHHRSPSVTVPASGATRVW